ncbi:MAG: hypothetical protein IJJ41_01870 [Clostridia bacterium]|nr:hypothetical protein [Clostridia bacterium]
MAVFKCKNCGNLVEFHRGDTRALCPACGTEQALPQLENIEAFGDKEQLLERAFSLLATGEWSAAEDCCDQALELDQNNATAYLGKLMAERKVHKREQLAQLEQPFDDSDLYRTILWFADEALTEELQSYNAFIRENSLKNRYRAAREAMENAYSQLQFEKAADLFKQLGDYEDACDLEQECRAQAENLRKDDIYYSAKARMLNDSIHDYEAAIVGFESIPGWRDADTLLQECRAKNAAATADISQKNHEARERNIAQRQLAEKKAKTRRALLLGISIPLLCLVLALAVVLRIYYLPKSNYEKAVAAEQSGDVISAYEGFVALEDYKDSRKRAEALFEQYKPAKLKAANVGDIVYFGSYEQDNSTANGEEVISWKVLAKADTKLLLISEYALDAGAFHNKQEPVTWASCSLRKWLNTHFLDTAFTEQQTQKILRTHHKADPNPKYPTNPGKDTADKIFLLSIPEVEQYLKEDIDKRCVATSYAMKQGAATKSVDGRRVCWWWLRTVGGEQDYATFVGFDGVPFDYGSTVNNYDSSAIRPAMWIETKE